MSRFLLAVIVALIGGPACQKKAKDSSNESAVAPQQAFQGIWIHKINDECSRSLAVKEDVYVFENSCVSGENKVISEIEVGKISVDPSKFTFSISNHSCRDRAFTESSWSYSIRNRHSLSIAFSGGQVIFVKTDSENLPAQSLSITYGCFDKEGQFVANPDFKI